MWLWGLLAGVASLGGAMLVLPGQRAAVAPTPVATGARISPELTPPWHDTVPTPPPDSPLVRAETMRAGVLLRVRDVSGRASPQRPIYLASNWGEWLPDDPAQRLSRAEDGMWEIFVPYNPTATEPLRFKFTLGTWERCEVDAQGFSIADRFLPFVDTSRTNPNARVRVELTVARFVMPGEAENLGLGWMPRVSGGRVEAVRVSGGGGRAMGLTRDVWVWLPPQYDDARFANHRFPVLLMLDGQNIFDANPQARGEWGADEAVLRLVAGRRMEPVVVVAVPHAGRYRFDEYLSTPVPEGLRGPFAGAVSESKPDPEGFAAFLRDVVLPAVGERFRVTESPEERVIGGGWTAAGFAYYMASRHPDVFAGALCEDLQFDADDDPALRTDPKRTLVSGHPAPSYLSLGFGDVVNWRERVIGVVPPSELRNNVVRGQSITELASVPPRRIFINYGSGTGTGESAWKDRLPQHLTILFPPKPISEGDAAPASDAPGPARVLDPS